MADDMLSLGTDVAPWQIKDFSVALRRQQITQAARRQDCTVAEWLHGYFQRYGIDGQQFDPVKFDAVAPPVANGAGSIEDLCRLTEAAAKLAEFRERMPRGLSGALSRRLRDALRTPDDEVRPKSLPMLAAPEE